MNNIRIYILSIMLSISFGLFAGNINIDSLNSQLSNYRTIDTTYVLTLLNLSKAILKSDNQGALDFAELSLKLSDSLDYKKGIGYSYYAIGDCYKSNGNLDKAIINYNQAAELCDSIGDYYKLGLAKSNAGICYCFTGNLETGLELFKETLVVHEKSNNKIGQADIHNFMGNVYNMIGDNESSEKSYLQSLKMRKEIGDKVKIANLLNNLAIFYNNQSNYYKAMDSYLNALQVYDSVGDQELISTVLNGIGNVYSNINEDSLAIVYYKRSLEIATELEDMGTIAHCLTNMASVEGKAGNDEKALTLYKQAFGLLKEIGRGRDMSSNLNNQGIIYKNSKNFNESINLSEQSLNLARELDNKDAECSALLNLSNTYYSMGEYNTSKKNAIIALKLAEELGVLTYQIEINEVLSSIYEKENQLKKALVHYKTYKYLEDSLFNENNIKRITGLEYKYEFDKEKQTIYSEQQKKDVIQNEKLKQKTQQRNALIVGFVLILILVLVIYFNYLQKKKSNKKLVEQNIIISKQKEEKELLIKEIHHRVKNNLQIITSLFDLQMNTTINQETKTALIDGLNRVKSVGLIHQLLYQTNDLVNVDFKDFTIKLVDHIAGFATDKALDKAIIVPADIKFNIETTISLGLIINELLTNSFKYAFNDNEKCNIDISLVRADEKSYMLTISDNGVGLPVGFNPEESTSLGLRLVYTFVEQLSGNISYAYDNGAKFTLVFLVS